MTSNTTPAPLEAKSSSEHSNTHMAFMAFNGVYSEGSNNANTWASAVNQQLNSWLQINYGEKKRVNKVALSTRVSNYLNQTPIRFKILGSNDEVEWEELGYFHVPSWLALTTYEFDIKESDYSIYRVHNIQSSTTHCSWVQVVYGYEEPSVVGSFQKGSEKFILNDKEKLILPSTNAEKYMYSDCTGELEWSDDITRLSEIKTTDSSGRVTLLIENPKKYHTVRGTS